MRIAIRSRTLSNGARPSGNETTVISALKATRCAMLDQQETAKTAPKRSRHRRMAEPSEVRGFSRSRTAKIAESERNQLRIHAVKQTRPASSTNIKNASPGFGRSGEDTRP